MKQFYTQTLKAPSGKVPWWRKSLMLLVVTLAFGAVSWAQTTRTAVMNGNWDSPTTWDSGVVPASGDNIVINAGIEVTVTDGAKTINNLTLQGDKSVLDMTTFDLVVTGTVSNAGEIRTQSTSTTPLSSTNWGGGSLTGAVVYNAPNGGQTVVPGTYNDLYVIHTSGESAVSGNIAVGGIIVVSQNATLNLGTFLLTDVGGIGSGGQLNKGTIRTQNTSSEPLPLGRTWGGTIQYDAPNGGQKIVSATYNNLTVSTGSTNVNDAASITVNGALVTSPTTIIDMHLESLSGTFTAAGHEGTIRTQRATDAFPSGKTWGGTVEYDRAGEAASNAQTIILGNYHNLIISKFRGGNLTFPAGTIGVSGNLDLSAFLENTGDFITTGNTFNFNGSGSQSISVTARRLEPIPDEPFFFNNVTLSGGGLKTLDTVTRISGTLALESGVLVTSSSNMLFMEAGSSVSGGSNASYVSGPMTKVGNTAFTFPIGKGGVFAPLGVSAPASATDEFKAEYINASALSLGTISHPDLTKVSKCDYWTLDRTSGTSKPSVTLHWSASNACAAQNPYITSFPGVTMARFANGSWDQHGKTATSGSASQGTVTWEYPGAVGGVANPEEPGGPEAGRTENSHPGENNVIVTVGSTEEEAIVLPVKFTAVRAVQQADGVQVEWSTATEVNVGHYEVERSLTGRSFTTVAKTPATANNGGSASYMAQDPGSVSGTRFYRIKGVDLDGKLTYSEVVRVTAGKEMSTMTLYPNPVRGGRITLQASSLQAGSYQVSLFDATGRMIHKERLNHMGGNFQKALNLPSLKAGMYSLQLSSGADKPFTQSFVVQ